MTRYLRGTLHVWRLVLLWTVVLVFVWLMQLLFSALMLSWASISVEFPSASDEMDEWLHGPRAPAPVDEDADTEPRPTNYDETND